MPASFQSALRRSFVGAWRWLIDEDSVTATPEVAALYGVCVGAAGRGLALGAFIEAIHPDDVDRFRRDLSAAVRHGSNIDLTYRVICSDGSAEHVAVVGSCIRFLDDRPAEYLGAVHIAPAGDDPLDLVTDHLLSAARIVRSTGHVTLSHLVDMAMLEAGHCLARGLDGICVPMRRAL